MENQDTPAQPKLRPLTEEYAPLLKELVDRNRAYLRQHLNWLDYSHTLADALAFITQSKKETYAIWYQEKLVGIIALRNINPLNRSAEIVYWLDEANQGKGIMTRSATQLIEHAFSKLNLHRLEIRCAVNNPKSHAIANRLGFKKEGIARDALWLYDHFVDLTVYSKFSID